MLVSMVAPITYGRSRRDSVIETLYIRLIDAERARTVMTVGEEALPSCTFADPFDGFSNHIYRGLVLQLSQALDLRVEVLGQRDRMFHGLLLLIIADPVSPVYDSEWLTSDEVVIFRINIGNLLEHSGKSVVTSSRRSLFEAFPAGHGHI